MRLAGDGIDDADHGKDQKAHLFRLKWRTGCE
jgi:hypothetical protein